MLPIFVSCKITCIQQNLNFKTEKTVKYFGTFVKRLRNPHFISGFMYKEDESYFESYIKLCTSVGQHENIIKFYGISVVKGWCFNFRIPFLLL